MSAPRSQIHMLRVLAMRFENNAPEPLVETLRKFAQELEAREADGRTHNLQEQKRIEKQRTLFAMLPSSNASDHLREAMKQRAYDLMCNGDGLATDALLEFLPSADADEVFAAWDNDQDGDAPKSRFC
jgi:hypothetical protein